MSSIRSSGSMPSRAPRLSLLDVTSAITKPMSPTGQNYTVSLCSDLYTLHTPYFILPPSYAIWKLHQLVIHYLIGIHGSVKVESIPNRSPWRVPRGSTMDCHTEKGKSLRSWDVGEIGLALFPFYPKEYRVGLESDQKCVIRRDREWRRDRQSWRWSRDRSKMTVPWATERRLNADWPREEWLMSPESARSPIGAIGVLAFRSLARLPGNADLLVFDDSCWLFWLF